MKDRALYSIKDSRELLAGISRNSISRIVGDSSLKSVVIGRRQFTSSGTVQIDKGASGGHRLPRRCNPWHAIAGHCRSAPPRSSFRNLQHALLHKLITFTANSATLGPFIVLT